MNIFNAKELIEYCEYVNDIIASLARTYQVIEENEDKSKKFDSELIINMKQQLYDMALKLIIVTSKDDKCGSLETLENRLKNYMNGTYDITPEDLINQYINEEK